METSSTDKNYTITLLQQDELILYVEDLEGIIMQLDAISQGLGMDFTPIMVEEIEKTWEWSAT
jgi:hypothetical protein